MKRWWALRVDGTMATPVSSEFRLGHRPWLDGVRGFAVLAVMGMHYSLIDGGSMGVDVFFVLSGFLITCLLVEEWRRNGAISLKRFYLRRVLRLWPALVTCCVLYILAGLVINHRYSPRDLLRHAAVAMSHLANWIQSPRWYAGGVSHTWSLSLEEQFYLLWPPLLAWLLARGVAPRRLVMLAAGGALASAVWRAWLYAVQTPKVGWHVAGMRAYFGLDTRADVLLIGCALGLAAAFDLLPRSGAFLREAGWVGGASMAALVYLHLFGQEGRQEFTRGGFTGLALLIAAAVGGQLVSPSRLLAWLLENRFIVLVGRISYGLYLYHGLAQFAMPGRPFGWQHLRNTALSVALAFALALTSYYVIERPFLRLKDRLARSPKTPDPIADLRNAAPRMAA